MAEKKFELKFAAQTSGSDQLNKLTRAVEDLGNQGNQTAKLLDKIGQSAVDSDRQLAALSRSAAALERALSSSAIESSKKFEQLAGSTARLQDAVSKLATRNNGFAAITTGADAASGAIIGLSGSIGSLVGRAAGIALIGSQFVDVNRKVLETQAQVDKLRNILLVKNDNSIANTNKDLDTLRATSERLGLRFTETATAFAKLAVAAKGSALEGKATRDIFEAVSGTIAKLGVSGDGANRVFLALQQIISKGTVQTEELKGQLGEQIPGAMQIAARAVGVTTSEFAKMLEQGQVISADFLPKFAAEMSKTFGVSTTDSVNTATAAINRFDNATERLKQTLAEKLAPAATTVFGGLGSALDSLSEKISSSQGLFDLLFKTIADAPQIALDFATGIGGGQTIARTQEGRAAQLGQLEAALAKAQSESGKGGIYTRANTANAITDLKRLIAEIKSAQGSQEDVSDEFLNTLISQGRQQAENFKNLERGYKEQSDAIKGINKDYEIQIKLAKDARAAGVINDGQLQTRLAEINNKFGEKDKRAEVAKAAADEYAKLYQRVVDLTTAENLREASGVKLNNFMKLGNDLINEANEATSKLTEQQRKQIVATGESLIAIGKVKSERELERDLIEQAAKEMSKQADATLKGIEAIEKENQALRDKIASVGVSNEQAADAINLTDEARVQALELSQALYTEADAWDFVRISQEKELEALRERIKLRKELGAARDAQAIADRQAASFTNLYRDLSRGISDSIFRGFEGGKKFINVFKDAIRNAFKTFAIKVAIQPVIGSIIGTIAGTLGFQGLANAAVKELGGSVLGELGKTGTTPFGGSGGGSLSAISGAKSLYDMVGGGFSALSGSITNGLIRVGDYLATSQSDILANIGTSINSGSFASNAGALGAKFAGVAGGYAANRFLSNGYQVGGFAGTLANNASLIGFINPVAGLIAGAIGGAVNRLFGSKTVLGASGIEGTIGQGGFSGSSFQDVTIKRKLRSDKSFTNYATLPPEVERALDDTFSSVFTSVRALGTALGTDVSRAVDSFTLSGRFAVSSTDDLKASVNQLGDALIKSVLPSIEQFAKEGERLLETAARVSSAVQSANEAAIALGAQGRFGIGNADSALSFGSNVSQQAQQNIGLFVQQFGNPASIAAANVEALTFQIRALGLEGVVSADTTREAFGNLVRSMNVTTEAGQRELNKLLLIAPALAQVVTQRENEIGALTEQARQQKALQERLQLEVQLFELTASETEKLEAQRNALDESNRAIFDQIQAVKAQQEAAQSAAQAIEEANQQLQRIQGLGGNIREFINDLMMQGASAQGSLQIASRQYNNTLALAQNNDEAALGSLPDAARQMIDAARDAVGSQIELDRFISKVVSDLSSLPATKSFDQQQIELLAAIKANTTGLDSGITVELTTNSKSEIEKLIKFISVTDQLPPDLKTLALSTSQTIAKTIDFIGRSSLSVDDKVIALKASETITKTIQTALGATDPVARDIALKASEAMTKVVQVALGTSDSSAIALAFKGNETIAKYISAYFGASDGSAINYALKGNDEFYRHVRAYFGGSDGNAINYGLRGSDEFYRYVRGYFGGSDWNAVNLALRGDDTLTRYLQVFGGALSADQSAVLRAVTGTTGVSLNAGVTLSPDNTFRVGLFWWNTRNLVTSTLVGMLAQLVDIASYTRQTAYTGLEDLGFRYFGTVTPGFLDSLDNVRSRSNLIDQKAGNSFIGIADIFELGTGLRLSESSGDLNNPTSAANFLASIFGELYATPSALGNIFSGGQVVPFANGGAFTNSIASSPTMAPMALFGEAGPEAIMPLRRGPDGSLGVVSMNSGNDAMAAEIRALRQEVAMLRAENRAGHAAVAANTGKTARILDRADNGDSLNIAMVTA